VIYKIIIGVAVVILFLVYTRFTGIRLTQEMDLYKNKIENDYTARIDQLQRELRRSNLERNNYAHRVDSISLHNETILRSIEKKDKEIAAIKGRYKNHTPTELEIEMEKRYERN
jgi:hypothetical protein